MHIAKLTDPIWLRQRLSGPLPGREAQLSMAHLKRLEDLELYGIPQNPRIAAVMLLLFPCRGVLHTILIERSYNPNDRHSGQLSFPGGKQDPDDTSLTHTALRETREEIGIPDSAIELLGSLTELYIPVSNFLVHPFVGYLPEKPTFSLQVEEVSSVLTPPLATFTDPATRKMTDLTVSGGITLKSVPYFEVEGRILWGATAMVLSEFVELIG